VQFFALAISTRPEHIETTRRTFRRAAGALVCDAVVAHAGSRSCFFEHQGATAWSLWHSDIGTYDPFLTATSTDDALEALAAIEQAGLGFFALRVCADGTVLVALDAMGIERVRWEASNGRLWLSNRGSDWANSVGSVVPAGARLLWNANSGTVSVCAQARRPKHRPLRLVDAPKAIRRALSNECTRLGQHFDRIGVMLSGGIDSSAVAAAVATTVSKSRVRFVHARFPRRYRVWEATNARRVARSFGTTLVEIQLESSRFFDEAASRSNPWVHGWLGWQLQLQRQSAPYADVLLTGRSGEWFGRDSPALLPRAIMAHLPSVLSTRCWQAMPWRGWLKGMLREPAPTTLPQDLPFSFATGQRYLYANERAGVCVPKHCPFQSERMLSLANAMAHTGARTGKLALRIAFPELPKSVTGRPRQSTPPMVQVARSLGIAAAFRPPLDAYEA
jgi:hypothetical protein